MIIETAAVLAALFVPAGHVRLPAQSPVAAKPIQWEGAQTFASSAYRTGAPYSAAAAYEPSAAPVYYVRGEKTELFNHVDLTGWTNADAGEPKGWKVVDGLLYHDATGDNLFTEKQYESFILEFEFLVVQGDNTNSGVKYKTWYGDNWWMGCEYQILDDNGSGDSGELHLTASLYDVYPPAVKSGLLKYGQFNQGKIVVMGNYVEHWLNGQRTVAAVIGSPDWNARVAKSKFQDEPNFGKIKSSRIFLQHHSTPVSFRNISITELKPL